MIHLASGLTDTFTAAGGDPAYRIRVVVAARNLAGRRHASGNRGLPCSHPDPDFGCASTEIQVPKANSSHVSGFRVGHVYPEQVMLLWAGAKTLDLERSSDGGETWDVLGRPETENYAVDADIVEGSTYHYRGRYWQTQEWVYLDISLPPPGAPVTIPVWSAPRVLPQLDEVTWHCPDGAARPLCDGTLHMRLQSEPGTGTLGGATIRVYLNEETFELTDGTGNEIHTEFNISNNYLVAFRGYDLPACVVRKPTPDLVIEVPHGEEEATVDLGGSCSGPTAPFRGRDGGGDISERALLVLIMEEPVQNDPGVDYLHFLPVLFGDVVNDSNPAIAGVGPAGRHSPDCVDGDSWYYFDHFAQGYNTALFFNEINFAGDNDRLIWTDTVGGWSASYSGLADGPHPLQMTRPGVQYDWGMVGREIYRPTGGFFTADYSTEVETEIPSFEMDITVDPAAADLTPNLASVLDELLIDSANEIADGVVRFRITDSDQDLDMGTVQVFNCSLEACSAGQPVHPYAGFYSWDQKYTEGNYGWFVVELPLTTANDGLNDLVFCAADLAENPLGTPADPCVPATITRQSPLVEAIISEPATSQFTGRPGALVPLDGSDSLFPEDGVALWTIGRLNGWGDEWCATAVSTPSSDPMDLMTQTMIPNGSTKWYRARCRRRLSGRPA